MRFSRTFSLKTLVALTLTTAVLVQFGPAIWILGEAIVVSVRERIARVFFNYELERVNSASGRPTSPDF